MKEKSQTLAEFANDFVSNGGQAFEDYVENRRLDRDEHDDTFISWLVTQEILESNRFHLATMWGIAIEVNDEQLQKYFDGEIETSQMVKAIIITYLKDPDSGLY